MRIFACQAPNAASTIAEAKAADLKDSKVTSLFAAVAEAGSLYTLVAYRPKEGACPKVVRNGDTTIVSGGCESASTRFTGSVEITGADPRYPDRVVYRAFGADSDDTCEGDKKVTLHSEWNGELTTTRNGDGSYAFAVDVALLSDARVEIGKDKPCKTKVQHYAAKYTGTLESDGAAELMAMPYVGSANGTLVIADQRVEVTADRVAVDLGRCKTEPLSGTTTLHVGTDTAIVTYDGAASCDEKAGAATWQLNGTEKGAIGTSICSANAPEDAAWIALAALGLLLRRRRSSMKRG